MGHQPRPLPALFRHRLRLLFKALYPSFSFRRAVASPISFLSITFVFSLIFTGTYLVIPLSLIPQFPNQPITTTVYLIIFSWTILCTIISYLLTAITHPGRIPDSWRPLTWQREHQNTSTIQINIDTTANPPSPIIYPVPPPIVIAANTGMTRPDHRHRFCTHCNIFKPDRAHHCSTCRECILQMDHHCPFTGNSCIGFLNRKFFLLFLIYATISCSLVAYLSPNAIISRATALDDHPSTFQLASVVFLMVGYLFCSLHAIALSLFTGFHIYLVLKNRTTIENQEPHQQLHEDILKMSDKSWLNNWKAVLGSNPWLWFIPVAYGREGDGMKWISHNHKSDEIV